MTSQSISRRRFAVNSASGCALLALGCGGGLKPAEYPELKLRASSIDFSLVDSRKRLTGPIDEPLRMDRGDEDTYEQALPSDFEQNAKSQVRQLISGKGPRLQVQADVRRCGVTFYNDPQRGDFVRYDVAIGFKVTTARGALLDKGKGGAFQELPNEEATPAEMRRVFSSTAVGALDQYFASEETLETINEQIERYLQTHPDEK